MLTPQEISERELVKAVFGGYDVAVVDDFLETIAADYAALYKENAILKSKIKVLVEKVEEYRSTEDSMRMALLTAQKMGEDLLKESQAKSEAMVKAAQAESEATLSAAKEEAAKLVKDLQTQVADEETRLAVAKNATAAFIRQSRELAGKVASFLDAIPELEMKKTPAPAKEEPAVKEEAPVEPAAEEVIEEPAAEEAVAEEVIEEAIPVMTAEEIVAEEKPKLEEEYTSRPKFDFDNLRFGTNFTEE